MGGTEQVGRRLGFYIDDEALKTYHKESEDNMKFVYDHSDDIMQALKND